MLCMPMTITVTNDDGSTADITEAVLIFLDETYWSRAADDLTREQVETSLAALQAMEHPDAAYAAESMESALREREAAERRRDEWARTQAEREADRVKAAAQLAAEMREAEPALVRAGWTDAQLVHLRYMRNAGLA